MSLIYLDNNATTKVDPQVLEAMLPYLQEEYANPSSVYDFAKRANHALSEPQDVKIISFSSFALKKSFIIPRF